VFSTARPFAWPPSDSGYLFSAQSSCASRASASDAGSKRIAPEVVVLATRQNLQSVFGRKISLRVCFGAEDLRSSVSEKL
jgi:hypothetical protein